MRFMCPLCSIDGILPRDSPIKTDLTSQSCFPRYISPACTFYISCSRSKKKNTMKGDGTGEGLPSAIHRFKTQITFLTVYIT